MGSRELNPDLTGSDGAALSSSGEHALLHMQCSGPPALSHYVRQSHTGCRGHAHRLPDSSKKKKKKKKISKKGNGKIQRKRYQPRAFITNWTTAARNNRNLCYSNRKVVVNVREREFNKLLGFTNKKVIHCQVHWICLVPCRMLNRMEPDPRWGESQHDGSLFVSSSLP